MAITYGMSVKEFWEDSPDLFWAYRFSYLNRLKTEQEMFNHKAWLQGAYFHEAISISLGNAFGKGKYEYSKEPYNLNPTEVDTISESEKLAIRIKERVAQVQAIKGENKSSTTEEGTIEGGEKVNE